MININNIKNNIETLKKELPSVGQVVKYEEKEGKVISVDVLSKTYKIETKEKEIIEIK